MVLLAEGRRVNLSCSSVPSFVVSITAATQVYPDDHLFKNWTSFLGSCSDRAVQRTARAVQSWRLPYSQTDGRVCRFPTHSCIWGSIGKFGIVINTFYLKQAHLTELSEEQAKYMGLSKTGKLKKTSPGSCWPLSYLQALSNQTTIATSEDMVVVAWCSSNGKTAFALYSIQWKCEHRSSVIPCQQRWIFWEFSTYVWLVMISMWKAGVRKGQTRQSSANTF